MKSRRLLSLTALAVLTVAAFAPGAGANNSWGSFHWARTANPFTLKVGDNVGSAWDSTLNTTVSDWTESTVLDLSKVTGQATTKRCRATSGRVEVCAANYGYNQWLGIAQIWATGNHITKGSVKMNDSYFNTSTYNTTAWRNLVMCQEVGHILGLGHQDEIFDNPNLGTCMDYTNNPGTNQHPNQHDYDQLETIYTHLDSFTTLDTSSGAATPAAADDETPGSWGRAIRTTDDGTPIVFVRELGAGQRLFTFVVWTVEAHQAGVR
ncbi:MAG: hypothetical protein ACRDJ4_12285 [Actinomycetota bacterium]